MMIKCKECKSEISDKADKCPRCGYKPKSGCLGALLITLFSLTIYLIWAANSADNTYRSALQSTSPTTSTPAKPVDQKQQETLKKLILGYTRIGLLHKVEKISQFPHAYITQKFRALTIDEKRILLGVVLSYYKNTEPDIELVGIYDAQSGKHIGRFDGYNLNID